MPLVELLSVLSPYSEYLFPVFFIGFFVATGLAYWYQDRYYIRHTYLAGFFVCLLLVNMVGLTVLPLTSLHKFSSTASETYTVHTIHLVTADGQEILYDSRAAPPLEGTRIHKLGGEMVTDMNERDRNATAEFLFSKAVSYRTSVESDPPVSVKQIKFPRHVHDYKWRPQTLAQLDEFTRLRIYKQQIRFTDDDTDVTVVNETVVYEWRPTAMAPANSLRCSLCS